MNRQDDSTYQTKSLHSAHFCTKKKTKNHATISWLANNYLDRFKVQLNMDWKAIVDLVRENFNINISNHQAYTEQRRWR